MTAFEAFMKHLEAERERVSLAVENTRIRVNAVFADRSPEPPFMDNKPVWIDRKPIPEKGQRRRFDLQKWTKTKLQVANDLAM